MMVKETKDIKFSLRFSGENLPIEKIKDIRDINVNRVVNHKDHMLVITHDLFTGCDLEDLLDKLASFITFNDEFFSSINNKVSIDALICYTSLNGQGGIDMNVDRMRFFSKFKVSLIFDLYFLEDNEC